jgi:hypothetical protein
MKAVCTVYNKPKLRFTPNHCDHFLHIGLKSDVYPHGILGDDMTWGWFVMHFEGVWKILPECGFFLDDSAVREAAEHEAAMIITIDWEHPGKDTSFPNTCLLVDRSRKRPYVFDRGLWKGECLRCGTCCSVPRRRTGRPCEYLKFADES